MKILCAYCGKIKREDDGVPGLDSHGICLTCRDKVMDEIADPPSRYVRQQDKDADERRKV